MKKYKMIVILMGAFFSSNGFADVSVSESKEKSPVFANLQVDLGVSALTYLLSSGTDLLTRINMDFFVKDHWMFGPTFVLDSLSENDDVVSTVDGTPVKVKETNIGLGVGTGYYLIGNHEEGGFLGRAKIYYVLLNGKKVHKGIGLELNATQTQNYLLSTAEVGYQLNFQSRFSVEFVVGVVMPLTEGRIQYPLINGSGVSETIINSSTILRPNVGISLGYKL